MFPPVKDRFFHPDRFTGLSLQEKKERFFFLFPEAYVAVSPFGRSAFWTIFLGSDVVVSLSAGNLLLLPLLPRAAAACSGATFSNVRRRKFFSSLVAPGGPATEYLISIPFF